MFHSHFRRKAGFQLGQRKFCLSVSAFFGGVPLIAVQREVACDFSQIDRQAVRTLRRDRIPCTQIGVIGAFLRIFSVVKDVVCDRVAVVSVLFCGSGNRVLVARPVHFYDLMVSHCDLPSFCVKAFHLYRQQKSPFIAYTEKFFQIYYIIL